MYAAYPSRVGCYRVYRVALLRAVGLGRGLGRGMRLWCGAEVLGIPLAYRQLAYLLTYPSRIGSLESGVFSVAISSLRNESWPLSSPAMLPFSGTRVRTRPVHVCVCVRERACTCTRPHTRKHMYTHTHHTHTCTPACTRAHTQTHVDTQTRGRRGGFGTHLSF